MLLSLLLEHMTKPAVLRPRSTVETVDGKTHMAKGHQSVTKISLMMLIPLVSLPICFDPRVVSIRHYTSPCSLECSPIYLQVPVYTCTQSCACSYMRHTPNTCTPCYAPTHTYTQPCTPMCTYVPLST